MGLLDTEIRSAIADGFRGVLDPATLRRPGASTMDANGDLVPSAVTTYAAQGVRESFSAYYRAQASIPDTDVSVLLILGLMVPPVTPVQDDQVYIKSQWYQVRRVLEIDPAGASIRLQCYAIPDPTV